MMEPEGPIRNEAPETDLKTADFAYDLPRELIAQRPAERRDGSRLMVLNRTTGAIRHLYFRDVVSLIRPADALVINDSKVFPARLRGCLRDREEARVELLLLREREPDVWECLVKPGKRAREGRILVCGAGRLTGEVLGVVGDGNRLIRFTYDRAAAPDLRSLLREVGEVPLPPYITGERDPSDRDRYQTVYARDEGSAAAPTAGLHFTRELLRALEAQGTAIVRVTLHVGIGTFRPVREEAVADHVMHTEFFTVSEEAAALINERRAAGGRVVCVGTTSCRTLETASDPDGTVRAMSGDTGIFIYPGYRFKATDALITNFHLPESTLLMLVSAFCGRERILAAYREAIALRYRFFSFGDAMFIGS